MNTNFDLWCDQWQSCITAFPSQRTNLSPFTKGCRERDASMWLSQIFGEFPLQQYKHWQFCTVATHNTLRKLWCDTSSNRSEIANATMKSLSEEMATVHSKTNNALQNFQDSHNKYFYSTILQHKFILAEGPTTLSMHLAQQCSIVHVCNVGVETPQKFETITLMHPIHGNL